jgi:hypothetical protein
VHPARGSTWPVGSSWTSSFDAIAYYDSRALSHRSNDATGNWGHRTVGPRARKRETPALIVALLIGPSW